MDLSLGEWTVRIVSDSRCISLYNKTRVENKLVIIFVFYWYVNKTSRGHTHISKMWWLKFLNNNSLFWFTLIISLVSQPSMSVWQFVINSLFLFAIVSHAMPTSFSTSSIHSLENKQNIRICIGWQTKKRIRIEQFYKFFFIV